MAADWWAPGAEARPARTSPWRKLSAGVGPSERPVLGALRGDRSQAQALIGCGAGRK